MSGGRRFGIPSSIGYRSPHSVQTSVPDSTSSSPTASSSSRSCLSSGQQRTSSSDSFMPDILMGEAKRFRERHVSLFSDRAHSLVDSRTVGIQYGFNDSP